MEVTARGLIFPEGVHNVARTVVLSVMYRALLLVAQSQCHTSPTGQETEMTHAAVRPSENPGDH